MADMPDLAHKPSQYEIDVQAGEEAAISGLVERLGSVLFHHLGVMLGQSLNRQDREDLMSVFITDVISGKVKYVATDGPLVAFAKTCVYREAIDLLRKKGRQTQRELDFMHRTLPRLVSESPAEQLEFSEAVERTLVALENMPANHAAAVRALIRYGRAGYKDKMIREYGITGDLAAKWLQRGLDALEIATGLHIEGA